MKNTGKGRHNITPYQSLGVISMSFQLYQPCYECMSNSCHNIVYNVNIKTLNYNTPSLSCRGQITLSNIDETFPLAIPNQISFISMHVPSLVKSLDIYSSYRRETKIWACLGQITPSKCLTISNPNQDLHNINAHTKFGENQLTFTQIIIRKQKYGRVSGT